MPQIDSNSRKPVTAALVLLLASLVLAACGGSSTSSSTSTVAAATTSTTGNATGPNASRFTALRECLQKNGITLPKRTPGQERPPGGGGFLGASASAGPTLPKGVTRTQYAAALKKCGGFAGGRFGGATRLNSPLFKQALARFAACMSQDGVKVPAPNTSGKGPVFNTAHLNTSSARFKAAETKCSVQLRGALPSRPGASGSAGGPG
jgi:hypothetical protein